MDNSLGQQRRTMNIDQFATEHRLRIQTDPQDATTIIPGRKGLSHVFEYGEGLLGVVVMPNAGTAHWWNAARGAFVASGMRSAKTAIRRAWQPSIRRTGNRLGWR